jgi:hypothetical protein
MRHLPDVMRAGVFGTIPALRVWQSIQSGLYGENVTSASVQGILLPLR